MMASTRPKYALRGSALIILAWLLMLAIDVAVFFGLYNSKYPLNLTHIVSFSAAAVTGYLMMVLFSDQRKRLSIKDQIAKLILSTALTLFLRGGMLGSLLLLGHSAPRVAIAVTALLTSLLTIFTYRYYVFDENKHYIDFEKNGNFFLLFLMVYLVALRLFNIGLPELVFEEAYYWNYAQHLDVGYLDHPPMVAWIIWLFTQLMGNHEFAVRFGAFACWGITAYFSYKLTRLVQGRPLHTILLIAVLPAFFAVGLIMTPDAPLTASWAATLYFLYLALICERRMAWVGVGIALGLGMLSKYTVALLVPAVLLFMLIDRPSRKWFFRAGPYMALILALAIFSPVIFWNIENHWASFLYQSHDRVAEKFEFSFHYYLLGMILLLTPTGFLSIIGYLALKKTEYFPRNAAASSNSRGFVLLVVLSLFPILVFGGLSLFRETKLYWTLPSWLGLIPYLAIFLSRDSVPTSSKILGRIQKAWPTTVLVLLILYGAGLHYLGLGFPGVRYPFNSYLLGWQAFGRDVEQLLNRLEDETGDKILVVGMDRNRIASGLAFYRTKAVDARNLSNNDSPPFQTSSWHHFGRKSLMYEYWFPAGGQENKSMLLVSRHIDNLIDEQVRSRVQHMGEVQEITFSKNGFLAGRYYYILVRGYRDQAAQ